jgi:hypothetical protein
VRSLFPCPAVLKSAFAAHALVAGSLSKCQMRFKCHWNDIIAELTSHRVRDLLTNIIHLEQDQ